MININKNESKDVYLTLTENQTLIATTVSSVYYLFEAESNDTHNKSYWYSDDSSTNINRYNKFRFNEGGTFSYNSEFTLDIGTYDYRVWETSYLDLDVTNATSCLETGLMRVVGTVSYNINNYYNDRDDNFIYE